jgi:hypothetical protein
MNKVSQYSASFLSSVRKTFPPPLVCYLQGWIPRGVNQVMMAFREIENLMPMKEPADKTKIFRALLKGQALSYFEHHLRKRVEA